MAKILVLFLLTAGVLRAQSETVDLRSRGSLTYYLDESWQANTSEFGERVIVAIEPVSETVNANCNLTVTFPERDDVPTKEKLALQLELACRQLEAGSAERKTVVREIATRAGFGCYANFTDPDLVGKKPQKGNFKTISIGFIRVAPNVLLEFAIHSDGFRTAPYQQLLGALEGMEYDPRRRRAASDRPETTEQIPSPASTASHPAGESVKVPLISSEQTSAKTSG